ERMGRDADAAVFEKALSELEGTSPYLSIWVLINRFRDLSALGKLPEAKVVLETLVRHPSFASFSDEAKLLIAQAAPEHLGRTDLATQLLKSVKQPVVSLDGMQEPDFSGGMHFFRFVRLLMLTGTSVAPSTIAPDPSDPRKWPE